MQLKPRIALSLPTLSGSATDSVAMAREAESKGYTDIWLADAGVLDALTISPLILANTEAVRLGIAVVPAYTRTPAVLAASIAVIAEAFPGRFVPGLGTSSHTIIENWHGLALQKPLARMRETVSLLRTMMAGEKTAFEGETLRSHGYRMPPIENVPIYLAALREIMLECAAEIADGVIINLFPRALLPRIMEHIEIGAKRGGKRIEDIEVVCRHMVVVTDDKAAARESFRKGLIGYYSTPVYNRYLAWAGYEEIAREIRAGWEAKDRERTAAALPDELIDEIAVIGSAAECQQMIRDYAAGGIHTNIINCILPNSQAIDATLNAFAAKNFSF